MKKGMVLPGTDKEIMELLMSVHRFTTRSLAEALGVDMHTVQNLLANKVTHINARLELIRLYVGLEKKRLKSFAK